MTHFKPSQKIVLLRSPDRISLCQRFERRKRLCLWTFGREVWSNDGCLLLSSHLQRRSFEFTAAAVHLTTLLSLNQCYSGQSHLYAIYCFKPGLVYNFSRFQSAGKFLFISLQLKVLHFHCRFTSLTIFQLGLCPRQNLRSVKMSGKVPYATFMLALS